MAKPLPDRVWIMPSDNIWRWFERPVEDTECVEYVRATTPRDGAVAAAEEIVEQIETEREQAAAARYQQVFQDRNEIVMEIVIRSGKLTSLSFDKPLLEAAREALDVLVASRLEQAARVAETEFADPAWNGHYTNAGITIAERIRGLIQ